MSDCLFCNIVQGKISADIVFQDNDVLAFRDISPKAPTHLLVIPKQHIATLNDLTEQENTLIGKMHLTAMTLAKQDGIADSGYRVLMNCNADGGQTVYHIHLHVLGGRALGWPPG